MIRTSWFVISAITITDYLRKMKKNDNDQQMRYLPLGMCLGISIGMAIGAAMDNIPIGMCMGMGIGMCFGSALDNFNNSKKESPDGENKEE